MSQLINDVKCRAVQAGVYAKLYKGHKPNEWEPWKEPGEHTLANGLICRNDIQYSEKYPNSFFDVWYPDDQKVSRPVVVYFHGGGFIFGDKTTGDPLADGGGSANKLIEIVKLGYAVINANYALAPEYRFPVQIEQVDLLMRYLRDHANELMLDMNRVCLSGGSAGADLTEIYGVCVCNPEYAQKLGISPVMTKEQLKVLLIDEAALDANVFEANMFAMLGCWTGAEKDAKEGVMKLINAKEFIRASFIPSWVNASNEGCEKGGFFSTEAIALKEKLDAIHVDCDLVYFPGAGLPHGYMDQFDRNPQGKEALTRMLAFLQKYI